MRPVVVLALVAALFTLGCVAEQRPPEHPRIVPVVGEADLARAIADANGPVVVDFWQRRCPPCGDQARALHALVEEYPGLLVLEVSLDESENARAFAGTRVSATPTIEIHRDGERVFRKAGLTSAAEIRRHLD